MKRADRTMRRAFASLGLVPLVLPATALAHVRSGEAIGFVSGLQHPVFGLDHVLAMVAVGLRGAQLGAPARAVRAPS